MKVAIMQPYFFPYLGYFSLIKHTDKFILLDTVQFMRHGWIERNRVLKQSNGWIYIQVPLLNKGRSVLIKDLRINLEQDWKRKILAQLESYKKIAPYYNEVLYLINKIFIKEYSSIVDLNFKLLKEICKYLGIESDIEVFSKMDLTIRKPNEPDEWALNICNSLDNVKEYWNPPGGQLFFDKAKFDKDNIELKFLNIDLKSYNQKREPFEGGLSIIDVMMFNSKEEIQLMLNQFKLV